jgi:hypothetical protein
MRVRAAALVGVMLAVVLSGCSSPTEDYCGAVRDDRAALQKLSARSGDPGDDVLGESLVILDGLRDDAPEDISGDWDTFVLALRDLADQLEAAGVDAADYRPGQRPVGVSKAQFARITGAAEQLRSPRVLDAAQGIEDHAAEVCKVDLGL